MKDMSVGKKEMHVRVVLSKNAKNRLKKNKFMGFPSRLRTMRWAQDGANIAAKMKFPPSRKDPINMERAGACTQVSEYGLYVSLKLLS